MTATPHWLTAVRDALDRSEQPISIFFRDDDAGWDNPRLEALLDVFERHEAPIDLAVIPAAVESPLHDLLLARRAGRPDLLGLHQHGFSHANHQTEGRKCEFGPDRSKSSQFEDLHQGKAQLAQWFGDAIDPIFTPPWNRCTQDTADCLAELNFQLLSRTRTAAPLVTHRLAELGVSVDWCRTGPATPEIRPALGQTIANALAEPSPVGIMLHHAVMNADDAAAISELLELLQGHPKSRLALMRDLGIRSDP